MQKYNLGVVMQNKRCSERKPVKMKAEIHTKSGFSVSSTADISVNGIFITTTEPVDKGEDVFVTLKLSKSISLEIQGVVRRLQDDDNEDKKSGIGLEFIGLTAKDKEILEKLFG